MNTNGININLPNSEIGQQIQEKFSDERTLKAFDNILNRIDTLEKAVVKLTTVLEQAPGLMSMTVDMVDEGIKNAAKNGVHIEERLGAALELAEKLTAPDMVEKLNGVLEMANQAPGLMSMTVDMVDEGIKNAAKNGVHIEERLGAALELAEKLTAPDMVEKLNGVLEMANQAPGLMSMTMDMVDEGIKNAAKNGVHIEERLGAALELAEKLTAPDMVEKLNGLLEIANQTPGLMSMTMDIIDETYQNAANKGIDIEGRAKLLMVAAEQLTSPTMINNLTNLIELSNQTPGLMAMTVDMVDEEYRKFSKNIDIPAITGFLGNTGKALSDTVNAPQSKVGMFGMLRALGDTDRQRALRIFNGVFKAVRKGTK